MERRAFLVSQTPEITLEVTATRVSYEEVEAYVFTHSLRFFPSSLRVAVFRVGSVLIDAGSIYDLPILLPWLKENPPRVLLLTHHHEDHVGGASLIQKEFPEMTIWVPSPAKGYLENPPPLPFYRKVIWGDPPPLSSPMRTLPVGEVVRFDEVSLTVIPTPGHTPWHVGFLYAGSRPFVFLGDLVTQWQSPLEWYECSIPDKIASLTRILEVAPQPYLLPSHLTPVPEGREVLAAEITWLKENSLKVMQKAQELRSDDPALIAEHLFGREPGIARISAGEFGLKAFVRGVLKPVRELPATPLSETEGVPTGGEIPPS